MKTIIISRNLPGDMAAVWSYLSQPQLLGAWLSQVDSVTVGSNFDLVLGKTLVKAQVSKLLNSLLLEFSVSNESGKALGLIVLRLKQNAGRVELTIMDDTLPAATLMDKLFFKTNISKRTSFWHSKLNALEVRLEAAGR
ncbi:MAG: hypothetical protein FWE37_01270 [Spirochaetaceae bacterium]|nr:hypothetical protein [Spirochaetaceae bacterium]